MSENNLPNGVIDFKKAKSQLSAIKKAKKAGSNDPQGGRGGGPKKRFWLYLQYLIFLGVIAYFMQLCRH